jgi:rhodanese-related sulfurtransferase
MKKISILIMSVLLFSAYTVNVQSGDDITPQQSAALVAKHKAVIVDVRDLDEWQQQHIDGAIHMPLDQLDSRMKELQRFKNTAIITQCQGGVRSAKAQDILRKAGFGQVYNMEGGMNAWKKDGLPTE